MTPEHFPYIYDQARGRWIRDDEPEESFTPRKVAQAALGGLVLWLGIVATAMVFF